MFITLDFFRGKAPQELNLDASNIRVTRKDGEVTEFTFMEGDFPTGTFTPTKTDISAAQMRSAGLNSNDIEYLARTIEQLQAIKVATAQSQTQ